MENLKSMIKTKAGQLQINLLGFAARDRFVGLDPQQDPFLIFPDGQTVILVGQLIPRGTIRGVEEGTDLSAYGSFGYSWLDNQFVAQVTYDLVRFIEDQGWEACPIFPNPAAISGMGIPVADGRPAPNVTPDFDYAAIACGLGELGLNQEILTPAFGPRQRFQMIITDAVLESDPLLPAVVCDHCGACAAACPLYAVQPNHPVVRKICGQTYLLATINFELCKKCPNGGMANRLHPAGKPDRYAAVCNRACLAALDKRGIATLNQPFRTHETWKKNRRGDML